MSQRLNAHCVSFKVKLEKFAKLLVLQEKPWEPGGAVENSHTIRKAKEIEKNET